MNQKIEPLLLPHEQERLQDELKNVEGMLNAPPHIANTIDRGQLTHQRRGLRRRLEAETPKPFTTQELDAATKKEAALRSEFTTGMPTQEEMRKKPPGAVDKHMAWEKRNKEKILEWKNLRRRLHVTGDAIGAYGDVDLSNVEMYRPRGGVDELSMDGAHIPGKDIYLPPNIVSQNHMDPDERVKQESTMFDDLQELANNGDSHAKRLLTSAKNRLDRAQAALEE